MGRIVFLVSATLRFAHVLAFLQFSRLTLRSLGVTILSRLFPSGSLVGSATMIALRLSVQGSAAPLNASAFFAPSYVSSGRGGSLDVIIGADGSFEAFPAPDSCPSSAAANPVSVPGIGVFHRRDGKTFALLHSTRQFIEIGSPLPLFCFLKESLIDLKPVRFYRYNSIREWHQRRSCDDMGGNQLLLPRARLLFILF